MEYVNAPAANGSDISIKGSSEEEELDVFAEASKGWEERSRIACVMVGWKRPPNFE